MQTKLISESPILFGTVVIGLAVAIRYNVVIAIILAILLVFLFWFYRLPTGDLSPVGNGSIRSACYGTVKQISVDSAGRVHVIVFLSPMDVHHQFYPVSGTIVSEEYDRTGKYYLAYDIGKSDLNEKVITTIAPSDPKIPGPVTIQRIAGFLVHRITSTATVGAHVNMGARMGMIKFGSRTDVIIPPGAHIHVSVGDRITQNTIIASY